MRTETDLLQMASLPYETKLRMTDQRIKEWVDYFGTDHVYVSFSGGKDSLVVLHRVRTLYPDAHIPAVYCDTGLEYPELKKYVAGFENVQVITPEMTFRQVLDTYGYPLVSKEVSQIIERVRENLKEGKDTYRVKRIQGRLLDKEGRYSRYNCPKWAFLLDMDILISNKCCDVMKKHPFTLYEKANKRYGFLGTRALESQARAQAWKKTGCNAFHSRRKVSKPISFWTEQDVLRYLMDNQLALCSVYGELRYDEEKEQYETTGVERTGCMWCAYGCHQEKSPTRFEIMKATHPQIYDYIMKPREQGGLDYKRIFDEMNQHEGVNIHY